MMNRHGIWKAVISLGFMILVLIGCGGKETSRSFTFQEAEVRAIQIKTDAQNIKVSRSNDSKVKINMKANKNIEPTLEKGILTIDIDSPSSFINLSSADLQLEIPDKLLQSINLLTVSGDISLTASNAQELHLTTDSGRITVHGFQGRIDAEAQSGKIKSSLAAPLDIISENGGQKLKTDIGAVNGTASLLVARSSAGNIVLNE